MRTIMKTKFYLSALAVAAIAFAGCNKIDNVINTPESSVIPFSFTAVNADTKTTNDGVHANWAAGDQVNLFHAEASTSSYVSDGAFTAASAGSSVKFSGTLASSLTADNYDWYAIYPYNVNITTPANKGTKGYVTVGSVAAGSQNQTGNNSTAHIAGEGYPVAGKASNVAKATEPAIAMSLLTSLIEVNVTNGTASPITVTEISFTGTEDIVGTYFIDFVSSPVVYTGSGVSYVSNKATLTVTSGSTIAKDVSAKFYLAVKPFTAPSAGTITLSVTTAENGKQTNNKVLASAFSFNAGEVNTLNFTYNKAEEVIATAAFNGKSKEYTTGWSTTGTGLSRSDCVIIGSGENVTSPAFDLTGYSSVSITFTGRRYGTLSGSKATVDASIGGVSQGTIDFTKSSVGDVSGSIDFIPTGSMTAASIVFTCTNATSAGSTHGAGIGTITITGLKK